MARRVHTPSPSRSPGELAAGAAESGASSGCLLELIPKRGIALAQPFDRLLGFGRGMEDRGLVPTQDLHPVIDVRGMAIVDLVGEAIFSAKRCLGQAGHDFFESVSVIPKPLAELSVQPLGTPCGMRLMPISA